jgi:hypothetical protein
MLAFWCRWGSALQHLFLQITTAYVDSSSTKDLVAVVGQVANQDLPLPAFWHHYPYRELLSVEKRKGNGLNCSRHL